MLSAPRASPPSIKVFIVGISSGLSVRTTDGVMKAVLTCFRLMKPTISLILSSSEGRQMVPPYMRVVKISRMQASKVKAANWYMCVELLQPMRAPWWKVLLFTARWLRITPLGTPLVPDVKRQYAEHSGVTAGRTTGADFVSTRVPADTVKTLSASVCIRFVFVCDARTSRTCTT